MTRTVHADSCKRKLPKSVTGTSCFVNYRNKVSVSVSVSVYMFILQSHVIYYWIALSVLCAYYAWMWHVLSKCSGCLKHIWKKYKPVTGLLKWLCGKNMY